MRSFKAFGSRTIVSGQRIKHEWMNMSYGVKFVLKLVLLSRLFQSLRSFLPKDGGHLGKNVLVFIVSQAAEDAFSLI